MLEDKNGHCRKAEVLAMGNTIKKEREWCLEKELHTTRHRSVT
jgi:hypothetical protein